MRDRIAPSHGLLLVALLVFGSGLRLPGLFTDFWLDEIWTYKIALGMDSIWDVFTEVRHSNNHHLNTIWFYLWGAEPGSANSWIPYRIPAFLAGVGSIAIAWRIGARHGVLEAGLAGGLCAVSYLLVHYSSDARGYAPVIFFGLGSFHLLDGFLRERDGRRALLFQACTVLGFLSHLMYLHVFVASAAWFGWELLRAARRDPASAAVELRDAARLFGVPCVLLAGFYLFDVRQTVIGDGPELDVVEVSVRALSYALGGPPGGLLAARVALATLTVFAGAVVWWQRKGRDGWVFLAVVIFVSPTLSFLLLRPEVFFARYFLLSVAFGLVAVAAPLAGALSRGGPWRAAAAVGIAAFALGNGLRLADFYEHGRGDYLSTVRMIADSAGSTRASFGADHRFRTENLVRFYNRYLPIDRRLVYRDQRQQPDWLLYHRIGVLEEVAAEIAADGVRYRLVKLAPYSDLSGWHWLVYRRVAP